MYKLIGIADSESTYIGNIIRLSDSTGTLDSGVPKPLESPQSPIYI